MNKAHTEEESKIVTKSHSSVTGSHRRTLEAVFHHAATPNLEWSVVVGLIGTIGEAHERGSGEFAFDVAGKRHIVGRPHTRDLAGSEIPEIRQFLMQAKVSAGRPSEAAADPSPPASSPLMVVDHLGAKIFEVDVASDSPLEHEIRPRDPHHFLHHLAQRNQSRGSGQRAPEETAHYEKVAAAVAHGGKIVVIGHGTGKSNAADHLSDYCRSHHRETYRRVVREVAADLSIGTDPQLLYPARKALRL